MIKQKIILLIFILATFAFAVNLWSQQDPNYKELKLTITFTDTLLTTNEKFVVPGTDVIILDNKTLTRYSDYVFDYRNGFISISKELFKKYSFDTLRIYDVYVRYDVFPYNIKSEYSIFDLKIETDTLTGDTMQIAVQTKDFIDNIFEGTDLQRTGSLFRGFTLGTNKDLSLNSGFRLQLNGKLSSDIEINAALNDESTPIQPEGNTLKLQELDKVYIEIKSSSLGATLGDIDVKLHNSEFLNLNRKIQGAKGFGEFEFGNFLVTGAISRGKYNSNTFNGIDGVQGPYRLSGETNEINILVLSGTERVYIDGLLMTRGEQADYVIDYGLGQITFTNKRIINNATRVIVEFEYSDRKYSRSLIVANSGYKLFDKKLTIGVSYLNETDNEDKTIDFTLSESDKVILKNAGSDRLKASRSGVLYAGYDSLNNPIGAYVKVDTLINGSEFTFYRFKPGDSLAVYQVTFSYVGAGSGDYNSISTYQYDFVGIGRGSYAPILYLPVPTSYQIAGITLDYAVNRTRDLYFKFEGAYSLFNANKFAEADAKNGGAAFNGEIGFRKIKFNMLGINFENITASYKERMIEKKFTTLDRINSVEFNRNFDLFDSTSATEHYRDANLLIAPGRNMKMAGSFAQLIRGDFFNSTRFTGGLEFNTAGSPGFDKYLPVVKYSLENISSRNDNISRSGNWFKQTALVGYKKFFGDEAKLSFMEISAGLNNENRKSSISTMTIGDSLLYDSFRFLEIAPRISFNNILKFNFFAEFSYRDDDVPSGGNLVSFSRAFTQRYGLLYQGVQWFYADMDFAIRDRNYSSVALEQGNVDNKSVLVNSRLRFTPINSAVTADVLYSVTSERTAKIQKLYVLVPVGQGNYIYLGDLNNNGIQDENEFQLTNFDGNYIKLNIPTDQFFPTVDLKTSFRVTLKPSRYFMSSGQGILANVYNNFSAETYIRIDERSKDPNTDNIYFMKLNTFLNDSNTLAGAQLLQQDVYLFENNPSYSFRFRYQQLTNFSQYSSGNERALNIQRSIRARLGLTSDITAQLDYVIKTDRNTAPVNSVRNRNISGYNINTDLAYRPIPNIESGFQFNYTKSEDTYPVKPMTANINQQILRFVYSFTSSGRLRLEIERDEVILNTSETNFPYELTSGRPAGKSYYWRGVFDYSISKNLQATLNYDGRVEGSKQVIHTGRAQVTAFF